MAIVQISQIQIRRGLNQDLPQLASAEMGWSIDTQQLYIGNGTIAEGAPQTGITEILTVRSLSQLTNSFSANVAQLNANIAAGIVTVQGLIQNAVANIGNITANSATLSATSSGGITTFVANDVTISYTLNQGSTIRRTGVITASLTSSSVSFTDDYTETGGASDITLNITGTNTNGNWAYNTTTATTIKYSIKAL